MFRLAATLAFALFIHPAALAQQARRVPEPATVRVRLDTSAGPVIVALDARRAPRTVANFLAYVDDGRLDGTRFYRAVRRKSDARLGFVQGGIGSDARRMLPPLPLEPTSLTGLRHLDGTISMAHGADPNSANGNFSIMLGANPALDAAGARKGYAAFGRVVAGTATLRRILALPTGGGRDEMKGQMILQPVTIIRAVRIDGVAKPTGRPRPWLLLGTRR